MPGAKARLRLDGADPINRGLLRFLPLADGAGTVLADVAPIRKNGATVGGVGRPATLRGKALAVSAGTAYGQVSTGPVVSGLPNWSIVLSIQVASGFGAAAGGAFYCERAPAGNDIIKMEGLGAGPATNVAFLTIRDDGGTLLQSFGSTVINDGRWHHLVLTKNGSAIRYYVDGRLEMSPTWSGTDSFTNGGLQSTLGVDPTAPTIAYTTGNMSGLRLYRRALTHSEVHRLYRDPWAGTSRQRLPVPFVYPPLSATIAGTIPITASITAALQPFDVGGDTHDGLRQSRRLRRIEALRRRADDERLADAQALRLALEAALGVAAELPPEEAPRVAEAVQRAPKPADVDWRRVAEDAEQYARLSRAVSRLSALVQAEARRRADDDDDDAAFLLGIA